MKKGKDNLLKQGTRILRAGRLNLFVFGVLYYFISSKNRFLELLRYRRIKRAAEQEGDCVIPVNDYLMKIDFSDEGISKELVVNKKRERFTTEFVKQQIQEDWLIIDIGANRGYYALLEAQLAKKGKVYAIEPIPSNVEYLTENVRLNELKNITVWQSAVGGKEGVEMMNVCAKSNWCSFTENLDSEVIDRIEVPVVTLDSVIEKIGRAPDLVRMDVEGYEYEIIKGMKNVLASGDPLRILMELHPYWIGLSSKERTNEMINTLRENGFKIKAILTEVMPCNYRSIAFINRLRKILRLPEFGPVGSSYEDLESLLAREDIYTPQVLFER